MTTRQILAAAVLVPLVGAAVPAAAAPRPRPKPPKPVCNLVKDAPNDAKGTGTPAEGPYEAQLDILSADVATDATNLTAAFRLASVAFTDAGTSPTGRAYELSFVVQGRTVQIVAMISPAGESYVDNNGKGRIDPATKTLFVSVPIAKLPVQIKPKDKLDALRVSASRWVGTAPVTLGRVDTAVGSVPYVSGTLSCVKAGS